MLPATPRSWCGGSSPPLTRHLLFEFGHWVLYPSPFWMHRTLLSLMGLLMQYDLTVTFCLGIATIIDRLCSMDPAELYSVGFRIHPLLCVTHWVHWDCSTLKVVLCIDILLTCRSIDILLTCRSIDILLTCRSIDILLMCRSIDILLTCRSIDILAGGNACMVAVAFATNWAISLTDTDVGASSLQASCWSFLFTKDIIYSMFVCACVRVCVCALACVRVYIYLPTIR